jgi:hypothetical protein
MITKEKVYSESYKEVKTFLDSLTDPRNRFKKRWVHASMPNITENGFDGYPFIVLEENISHSEVFDFSRNANVGFRVFLTIYSEEPTHMDTISDELYSRYQEMPLKTLRITESPIGPLVVNGRKVYRRAFALLGRLRL